VYGASKDQHSGLDNQGNLFERNLADAMMAAARALFTDIRETQDTDVPQLPVD
jgi:hypothetical protein